MIQDREQLKLEYVYLKKLLKKINKQNITSISVPGPDSTEILTNPHDIQEAIIKQNIQHLSTPEASPLGKGEFLQKAIGDHCTSEFAERVLQRAITEKDKESIKSQETYELLQMMRIPQQQQ